MKVFISGGCKNGKSTYALALAKRQPGPLYYIATMNAADREDDERIAKHRREREGLGFITLEQPRCIENILEKCDHDGSFLLDSLTALLANEMFSSQVGSENVENVFDTGACERISSGLIKILSKIRRIVIVSDYIYSDAILFDPLTEEYRKSLAAIDRLAAKHCGVVLEAAYAQLIAHKGGNIFARGANSHEIH